MEPELYLKPYYLIFIVLVAATTIHPVNALTSDEVRHDIIVVFKELRQAEIEGGNVTVLTLKLNEASTLLDEGGEDNVSRASSLVIEVEAAIPNTVELGLQASNDRTLNTALSVAFLGVLGVLIAIYGSRIFWGAWLRVFGGWRVERT